MIRKLLSLALFLFALCFTATAQQLGSWRMFLSYQIATKSTTCGSIIYSLMNGNLLSYDTEDGEVRTYDHLEPLSDVGISHIAYSKEAGRLLIVYSNSNVDLMDENGDVLNLSALKDKRILDKEVSSVYINGVMAYLATGFGFVEVDMKEGVFRNTYRLGYAVTCIAASDEAVFLGAADGIRYCKKTENMQLEENWTKRISWGGFKGMCFFQDKLMAMNAQGLFALDPYLNKNPTYSSGNYTFLKSSNGQLIWGNDTQIGLTSDVTKEATLISVNNTWTDISCIGSTYWMSEQENGLRGYKLDGSAFVPTGAIIQPSSPIRDLGYNVSWVGDRLLVAGGINTTDSYNNPATSMYYENGEWTNFQEMEIPAEYSRFKLINTTDLVQDPLDDTHHFASLYRGGLCEYRNAKFVKLYNHDNSPLKSILPTLPQYYNYVLCSALSYDADGNLWMASTMKDSVLHVLKPDGK